MKTRITSTRIRQYYNKEQIFNGNNIENELKYFFGEPNFWNDGVYGWNYSVYDFGRFCVLYGYRSFPACVDIPEEIKDYMKKANEERRKISWMETEKGKKFDAEVKEKFVDMITEYINSEREKKNAKKK